MAKYQLIYLVVVGGIGALLIYVANLLIQKQEQRRLKNIRKRDDFHALQASFPERHSERNARRDALESVGGRFSIIRRVIIVALILLWATAMVFPFLGDVPATMLSLITAATAVIVGIAARPYVENIISGIVISFSNLLRVGDTVMIEGNYGFVEDITLTHTIIKVWDWRRFVLPNSCMIQKDFINYDVSDSFQWIYVEFWVSYGTDMEAVKKAAVDAALASDHAVDRASPEFWIMDLDREGVKCWIVAWAETPSDGWMLRIDIREGLLTEMQRLGIDTHLHRHHVDEAGEGSS